MSKNYESLTQEASEEEFENMANHISEKNKEADRRAFKIKRIEEARPTQLTFGRSGGPREIDEEEVISKGGWEDVVTADNYDDLLGKEDDFVNASEHSMWSSVAAKFGDPVKFEGNPFDRAEKLQKELVECARQAEEVMRDLQIEVKEEVVQVETIATDNSDSN